MLATDHGPLIELLEGRAARAGREAGAGGLGHSHGPRPAQPGVHSPSCPPPHGRPVEGRPRAYRSRGAAADEQAADRGFRGLCRAVRARGRRGGQAGVLGAVFHRRASGLRPAGDDRLGLVPQAALDPARQGAGLHPRPDGHRHVHVLHGPRSDERRAGLRRRAAHGSGGCNGRCCNTSSRRTTPTSARPWSRPAGSIWSATAPSV